MTRFCWWLVDALSRTLDVAEREAVGGDITESGETGGQALRDVLGLVARRQLALWRHWRPWLVLAGLVVPLGLLLSLVATRVAGMNSVYSWMYLNNWDWALLQHRAFWIVLAQTVAFVFPGILSLICLSWTSGFALATLSRRTIPVNVILLCLVLLFGELVGVGRPQKFIYDVNATMSSLTFYSVVFPLLVQTVLVLLPSLWGMFNGLARATLSLPLRTILWAPALATMALFATMQGVWWASLATHNWVWLPRSWQMPPLLLAIAGPVVYLATTSWQRWRVKETT